MNELGDGARPPAGKISDPNVVVMVVVVAIVGLLTLMPLAHALGGVPPAMTTPVG